ncbi:MAG: PBP1A family penicillin-binding protein [Succinivibrionaceae bacterium]|nr:PBP1A family penicillin-binding protein [Succinivibrionaceae bacterium]
MSTLRLSTLTCLTAILATLASPLAQAALSYTNLGDMPDVRSLKNVTFEIPMKIYTADNKLIGEFGESKRLPVALSEIPKRLQQAFLATEDSRFYEHSGVDPIGIARAALITISGAGSMQGASTITQQVARNFFLSSERTLQRKIREAFIAMRMEQVLTKEEILELYLNKIALGHRSYGVAAAAQTYYGKDLSQLTLAEMATIAGLPKAPSTLNPISYPERSKTRRHTVLMRMLNMGYITRDEMDEADRAPYSTHFHAAELGAYAPYVAEMARQFALDRFGESAYTDALEIYTTVSSQRQEQAQYAVFKGVHDYDQRHGWRGATANINDPGNQAAAASAEGLRAYLRRNDKFFYMHAAVVTEVNDAARTATLINKDAEILTLPWEGMSWAHRFKGDRNMGPAPKKPSEILNKGDLVYTLVEEDGSLSLAQIPDVEGALVALNPFNGQIEAMVGGFDFEKSKFNRVTQSLRQVGSNIKPFLYSAAIARGIPVNSVLDDVPIETWDAGSRKWWRPRNSPNRFDGPMTLRQGLAQSKNMISIRLIRQVGVRNFVEHLKKFGIEVPPFQQNESMALGSVEITPLGLVTGYSTFANGGYRLEPFLVSRITRNGEQVYAAEPHTASPTYPNRVENSIELRYKEDTEPEPGSAQQVLSHENAYVLSDLLHSVVYGGHGLSGAFYGTGGRAQRITGRTDLYGKTGTTNNVHDAWFSGFNQNLVASAWLGFDTDRDLGYSRTKGPEGGAYSALPIWGEFMKRALEGTPESPLIKPQDGVYACTYNGITDLCVQGARNMVTQSSGPSTGVDTSSVASEDDVF